MVNVWTMQIISPLRPSVERNAKKIELRLQTESNAWLIRQMLQYQPCDKLQIEFTTGGNVRSKITTTITGPTVQKPLGELTNEDIESIVGLLYLTRIQLMEAMQRLYPTIEVNDKTGGYLAHFKR